MADVFMLEIESPILEIPDVNSYNLYFGWYLGELGQNDEFFDEYRAKFPNRAIGLSEYGADANPAYHSSHPERSDYTEEYQCVYHEHMLKMIEARPWLWATHCWNMFDFAADGRDEGGKHGENQKGLVTFDRSYRKDAFYLYKAYWNQKDPFVHLCSKGYQKRAEAVTKIKVYSNQPKIALYVDGKLLVDPQAMMNDTFKGCGGLLGLLIGIFIERRWVRYEIPQGHPALPVLAAAGLGVIFAWDQYFAGTTIIPLLGAHWGRFVAYALELIFAVAAYPAFIKRIVRPKEATETVAA